MKKTILNSFFNNLQGVDFRVRYWDGDEKSYGRGDSPTILIFNRPLPIGFDFSDPSLALGEAYMDELIDIEGDFADIIKLVDANEETINKNGSALGTKVLTGLLSLSEKMIKNRQKENIQLHYDLGNEFFALWLDDTMCYSCAYFTDDDESLYQAQLNKIDHILKKLCLKSGDKLLDIGSGWGWLIVRAAQQFGVRATGITLSEEQFIKTKQRITDLGLTGLVNVELKNYLDLDEQQYQFDRIVSVGMYEHVGKEFQQRYFAKINALLVPGGLSLLHSITDVFEKEQVNSWMNKYIFREGYVPSVREIVWMLPENGFYLMHAESLRLHYARTLACWYENFDKCRAEVEAMFDRRFVRMWDLYLRGCEASFRVSGLDVFQFVFSKGLNNELPCTWQHLY